jgi:hypothetical protein
VPGLQGLHSFTGVNNFLHIRCAFYNNPAQNFFQLVNFPILEIGEWYSNGTNSNNAIAFGNSPLLRKVSVYSTIGAGNQPLFSGVTAPFSDYIPLIDCSAGNSTYGINGLFNVSIIGQYDISVICPSVPFPAISAFYKSAFSRITLGGMALCNNTGNMFTLCSNLAHLSIAGVKISFSIADCNFDYAELKRIIENDLGTPDTTATFTITGNPGTAQIMSEIGSGTIIVPAGWTVAN